MQGFIFSNSKFFLFLSLFIISFPHRTNVCGSANFQDWSRMAHLEQICSFFRDISLRICKLSRCGPVWHAYSRYVLFFRDINAGGFVQLVFHTCGMICFVVFGLGFGFPFPGTVTSLWESLAFSHLSTTTLIILVIRLSSSASRLVVIHKFCLITDDVDWSNVIVFIVLLSSFPFLRQIELSYASC